VVSAGLLSGPVLGGFLLDILDWRSIFYLRVPVGLIGLVMAWIILKEQRDPNIKFRFDLGGSITLFGALSCLLLFFNLGGRWGFASVPALVLAGATVILSALFVMLERKAAQPIVDLSLFRNRVFTSNNASLGIMFVAIAANTFLIPFYLVDGLAHSASKAGLLLAVVSLVSLIIAPFSGWLSDKIGSRVLCTVGISIICLALFLFAGLDTESGNSEILLKLVILGAGLGIFSSPNNSSIMGSVPVDKLGTASAMIATVRQVGMSIGIAIAGAIFTSRQFFHATQLSHDGLSLQILHKLSLVGGFQDTMMISAIICGIGIFTSLFSGKRQQDG